MIYHITFLCIGLQTVLKKKSAVHIFVKLMITLVTNLTVSIKPGSSMYTHPKRTHY